MEGDQNPPKKWQTKLSWPRGLREKRLNDERNAKKFAKRACHSTPKTGPSKRGDDHQISPVRAFRRGEDSSPLAAGCRFGIADSFRCGRAAGSPRAIRSEARCRV